MLINLWKHWLESSVVLLVIQEQHSTTFLHGMYGSSWNPQTQIRPHWGRTVRLEQGFFPQIILCRQVLMKNISCKNHLSVEKASNLHKVKHHKIDGYFWSSRLFGSPFKAFNRFVWVRLCLNLLFYRQSLGKRLTKTKI